MRRLREGGRPDFPPSTRDAQLLGGTLFAMLDAESGPEAAVELAATRDAVRDRPAIERAFGRPAATVERDWRDYLDSLSAARLSACAPGGRPPPARSSP